MKTLFKLTVCPATYRSIIITDAGEFRLNQLDPQQALRLWSLGTPYLRITRHGAQLLADRSPAQVCELMHCCKTVREVDHLANLHAADDSLAAAALRRIDQLRTQRIRA